jgi:hypothetical protein
VRPYLEITQHKKELSEWLMWLSVCLASVKPWVQTQCFHKTKIRLRLKGKIKERNHFENFQSRMNDRNYYKCIKYFYSVRNDIESGVKRRNPSGIYKNVNICTCFLYIDFVC